jgi:hypothetical protein
MDSEEKRGRIPTEINTLVKMESKNDQPEKI